MIERRPTYAELHGDARSTNDGGSARDKLVALPLGILGKTDLAVRVLKPHPSWGDCWLPRSLIELNGEQGNVTVTLPEWLAVEKGLV